MGTSASQEYRGQDYRRTSEVRRTVRLNVNDRLVVDEGGETFAIDVTADHRRIHVGCTEVTREAWDYILKRAKE